MGMMLRHRNRKKVKAKPRPREVEMQLQPVVETEVKKRGPHKQTKT